MQTGVAKGLKVPCLFMITEVSIRCQKTRRLVYGVYPRIPPKYTTGGKGGYVTSVGWQVTLCDHVWHVSSRSGVAG